MIILVILMQLNNNPMFIKIKLKYYKFIFKNNFNGILSLKTVSKSLSY